MKRTLLSVFAIGVLMAQTACTDSNSTKEDAKDSFLGEVGEAIYDMYELREQHDAMLSEAISAWKEGEKSDIDKDKAKKVQADYENAIRHLLEIKDNAIGMAVPTELIGDENIFTLVEPFTVKTLRLRYEDVPLTNSQTEVLLSLSAKLQLVDGARGKVKKVCLVDANDSIFYEQGPTTSYSENECTVSLTLEDYFGKKYNKGDDKQNHIYSIILKTKKILIRVANTDVKDEVRGELGLFDLQGPVKECTIKNGWGDVKRTFNEDGFWETHDGKALKAVYPYGIERDREGRIVAGKADADGNGDDYAYNEQGKVVTYHSHYFDDVSTETTTYDKNGNIAKKHFEYGGIDMIEPYDETYENIDIDAHGNWTKRKVTSTDGSTTIQTRVISYY